MKAIKYGEAIAMRIMEEETPYNPNLYWTIEEDEAYDLADFLCNFYGYENYFDFDCYDAWVELDELMADFWHDMWEER